MRSKHGVFEALQSFLFAAGIVYGCLSVSVILFKVDFHPKSLDVQIRESFTAFGIPSRGERILRGAFNESYFDLIDFCRLDNQLDYVECIQQISDMAEEPGNEFGAKWPWWFRTLLRDVGDRSTLVHGKWHILQYTDPNIQQCISEKSGTKIWRKLHCDTIDNKGQRAKDLAIKGNISAFNCAKLQDEIPDSDRMVFVRDPLDRFLSGFLDKCTGSKLHTQPHCEPLVIFQDNITSPIARLRQDKKKLFEIFVDTFPLRWNLHFIPQSLYCDGLYRHIPNYDFVGSMDRDFHADLRRLRDTYPQLGGRINKFFKLDAKEPGSQNYGVETKAATQTLQYYTPRTVRRVLEYYAIDYVMLNIPIPDWAETMLANGY